MKVWLGTAGYSYRDWVGNFYPRGTKSGQMLAHYSRAFPLVELNSTFYRCPTPDSLARLAEQTPANFRFLVKLPRSLSHEQDSRDLVPFRAAAEELRGRGKLMGLLCQLPQSAHFGPEHWQWLETLGQGLAGLSLAVEFRHRSWDRPDVPGWLRAHQIDLVSVDVPDLPGLFPRGLFRSGARVYIRLHSRDASAWYAAGARRYDYDYSDEQLAEWVAALKGVAGEVEDALVLFNNCFRGQALDAARRLRELLARTGAPCEIVEPAGGVLR